MLPTIQQLAEVLQTLLKEDANQIGRESGFIQRERKLSGASFAQSMVFGWQANPQASLEDLCQSAQVCGVEISPQGLQERLNSEKASAFLYQLLMRGLSYLVTADGGRSELLAGFSGVYIQDSSKIELPGRFANLWRGNHSGQSTLKVQAVLDYQRGQLELQLASGRQHDCSLQTVDLPPGSLRLADVGYFSVGVFAQLNQRGVWWLSRLPARAGIWVGDKVVHTVHWLAQQKTQTVDQWVELTAQRLPCRLIAIPVPKPILQGRQKRVRQEAKDRPHSQLKPETLALCRWTVVVTNLDETQATCDDILALLRLRWQIELLFKLWKHDLSLDAWRSQLPQRILSEVYAKLLLALIQHWLLLLGCWHNPRRSLVKATHALRKHAFHLLAAFADLQSLQLALRSLLSSLARCSVQKRKARPAAFQLLVRAFP